MAKVFDGDKLVMQIAKNGLNYAETAKRTGLHVNTVQLLCSGRNTKPKKLTIYKFASVLNCSPDDLMTETEDK